MKQADSNLLNINDEEQVGDSAWPSSPHLFSTDQHALESFSVISASDPDMELSALDALPTPNRLKTVSVGVGAPSLDGGRLYTSLHQNALPLTVRLLPQITP